MRRSERVIVTSELFPSSLNDCYIEWHKLCFIHFVRISHAHSSKRVCVCECMLSHAQLFTTPWAAACPWDSPGKNTGAGCHFLLQGIFLTQGSNPRLLHWQILYHCTTWEALTCHVINAQEFEAQKSTQPLMAKSTKNCYTGVSNVISMTTQWKDKAGGKNLTERALTEASYLGYVMNITLKVRISVFYQMMFFIIPVLIFQFLLY